ncbi:hypothetical protein JHL18_02695 [Clostridium sp. YIM B02505]|uniref:DUF5667 domain-containing protein n=1 Tax=Clostridium yunnanense TaxID=2800325 RepID=A0ABS1EJL1_9CLOT|nr:DUF5667 domain-containing protein [Clostridium yunnanense]MBK1809554.1 hypothetical protein [Clostridium yunnanense]
MKKKYVLALSLIFSLSFSVPAFAADTSTDKTTDYKSYAGLTPNSMFYPLDKAIENIKLRFTKDPNKKIEKLLEIQKERLGEIQTLVEKDKTDLVPTALEGLEDVTSQTQTEAAKIITDTNIIGAPTDLDTTVNDTNATADTPSEEIKEIDVIESTSDAIEDTNTASIEILDSIKDQLPKEAQDKLASVLEMQKQKKEAVKQMVAAIHDLNTARKQLIEASKSLKDATKSGDLDAIANAQETLNVANDTFTQKQTALETAKTNKQSVIHQAKAGKVTDDTPATEPTTLDNNSTEDSSNTQINSTSIIPNAQATASTEDNKASTTEVKKVEATKNKETKATEKQVKKAEHSTQEDNATKNKGKNN